MFKETPLLLSSYVDLPPSHILTVRIVTILPSFLALLLSVCVGGIELEGEGVEPNKKNI
jgi:hypothetical protein